VVLAALPDRLHAVEFVEFLVLLPDTAGRGVHHDVGVLDHIGDVAGDLEAGVLEGLAFAHLGDVQGVAALPGDVGLGARLCLGDADNFHIRLSSDRIGDTLADGAVSVDCYFYHLELQ
jgi:hypothetical protein